MIGPIVSRQFKFDVNSEISHSLPTAILLSIFKENISQLESARGVLKMYHKMKLTCKFLHSYASEDLGHYLRINNVNNTVSTQVFNEIIEGSFNRRVFFSKIRESVENELAHRWKCLINVNHIAALIKLIEMLSKDIRWDHIAREKLVAKVLDQPYFWGYRGDHYIRLLSLECAKRDARTTAQLFCKLPLIFLESGEEVGLECAKNDPHATLEFSDEFDRALVVVNFGGLKTRHFDNVIRAAQRQLCEEAQTIL